MVSVVDVGSFAGMVTGLLAGIYGQSRSLARLKAFRDEMNTENDAKHSDSLYSFYKSK